MSRTAYASETNNDTIYSSLCLEKQCGTKVFHHILNKPLGGLIEDLPYLNKMSSFSEYIENKHYICISPHQ